MKIQKVPIPKDSKLSIIHYDYFDCYLSLVQDNSRKVTPLSAVKAFLSSAPKWVHTLMRIRDKIVYFLGLKISGDMDQEQILHQFKGKKGESVGIFKVFENNPNEIILGEDDVHLDFRVSIMILSKQQTVKELHLTTTVKFNNTLGRLYFVPVKIFHGIIVKIMLRNMVKNLEN